MLHAQIMKTAAVRFLVLAGLLALPIFAVVRLGVGYRWAGAYALVVSGVTYWVYAVDKRRAQDSAWRVAEARLHLLELLGGWPGAFVAQRRLRHKCSKVSYQSVFWLIVLAYQFAAADSLQGWKLSHAALNQIAARSEPQK